MNRTKKPKKEMPDDGVPKIMFRKIGSGSFRTKDGRIIKPNQTFSAKLTDIPLGFRDVIVPVDVSSLEEKTGETGSVTPKFQIFSKGGGWFDVLNVATGKPVNEKSLRQDGAKQLIGELS